MISLPRCLIYGFSSDKNKGNVGKKGLDSPYSLYKFITEESQARNMKAGTEVEAMEECCLLARLLSLAKPAFL